MVEFKDLDMLEQYTLTRYMYSIGKPLISDQEYDKLECDVLSNYGAMAYTSYDDDDVPKELLIKVYGEKEASELIGEGTSNDIIPDLTAQVSKSMQSFRTLEECYSWISEHKHMEIMVSPKIDGINTASNFQKCSDFYKLNYARSRGKSGRALDISQNVAKVLPKNFKLDKEIDNIIFICEAILPREHLDKLNNNILKNTGVDPGIHTPRGGAMSMLKRSDVDDEVYNYLKLFVFRCSYGKTFEESLEFAKNSGFTVVPHEVYKFKYNTYEEYEKELSDLIYKYKALTEDMGITTDGLVLQINDRDLAENEQTTEVADGDNLAVKALAWEAYVYSSRVTDIIIQPSANQYCCKAVVESVYTESGKKLSIVNLYNPDTMISANVNVGSVIEFKYENETTISFLRNLSNLKEV